MSWRDSYKQGTFRGVPFKTESHEAEGGRRTQAYEFAEREASNADDLGRRIRKYKLDLYVIGEDYFADRDALATALEVKGPGELVHPYLGRKIVQAGPYTLSETKDKGGMARFTVQFVEAGEASFPEESNDAAGNILTSATNFITSAGNAFGDVFSVLNQPAFVLESATKDLNKLMDAMDAAVKKVTDPVANLTFAISNFKAAIGDLVRKPGELADRLKGVFETLMAEFEGEPETSRDILGNIAVVDSQFIPPIGETPARNQERANQEAILTLNKNYALANQAVAISEIEFTSTQEALQNRDSVIAALDEQLFLVSDDDSFQSIKEIQTNLARAVPRVGLSDTETFTPAITLPALVISHKLFGKVASEDEIVDENAVEHPGFVPGGQEIRVPSAG